MRRTSACFVPGSNPVGRRTLTLPCARSSGSTQAKGANALPAEAGSPALPGLRGRGPCIVERLHDFVGEIPLRGRKARLIVPAQPSADVVMHPRLRARDLVGAPMQLPYLLTAGSGTPGRRSPQSGEHHWRAAKTSPCRTRPLEAPLREIDSASHRQAASQDRPTRSEGKGWTRERPGLQRLPEEAK